ncbi:arsenate reductase [Salinisphaera sp. PC39]|uniref:arsenate reductase n=1 Tax=Salinisphaera sp. PC39 TaxID=1304156 RepID=UPI00333E3978
MSTVTLYGLKNCDTCTKARRWLATQGIDHRFVDLRAEGVERERIRRWLDEVGPETLINRRSRTWRELDESERTVTGDGAAADLLQQYPTLIKRPVLELDTGGVVVGFSGPRYETALAGAD